MVYCQSITYLLNIQSRFLLFSLYKIEMTKQLWLFISKISVTCSVNVNHQQNVQVAVYTACMGRDTEYLGSFQNKLVSSHFKWVPKYILFLSKLKGEVRSIWKGKCIDFSHDCLLCVGVMLTIIKVFINLFLLMKIGNIWQFSK